MGEEESPIQHEIFAELGLVISTWTGQITDAHLEPGYRALYEHPDWVPGMHEIGDLRQADLNGVSVAGFRKLQSLVASYLGDFDGTFRTAILTVGTGLNFGMGRAYGSFAGDSPEEVRLCRSIEEVEAWLGMEDLPI